MSQNDVSLTSNSEFQPSSSKIDSTQNNKLVENQNSEKIIEKLDEQEKIIKENQEKVLEELQSIRNELKERKRLSEYRNSEIPAKKVNYPDGTPEIQILPQPVSMKNFLIKHTFKNFSCLNENDRLTTNMVEYFGCKWQLTLIRRSSHLGCYIHCFEPLETGNRQVQVEYEVKFLSKNGQTVQINKTTNIFKKAEGWGWPILIRWENLEKNYLIDGNLTVECHMRIKKMIGIYKENLREFGDEMKEFSDVVLVVNEQKFHVLSKFLAAQSSYFKVLFLGQFNESSQSEIKLSGIDEDDFQNYLEVLYGHPAIDEYTVEGILMISDMYDTQTVVVKCEEFLMEKSKKSLKKKLELATRFNLEKLTSTSISQLKSMDQIRSVFGDIQELDPSLAVPLLKRALSLG